MTPYDPRIQRKHDPACGKHFYWWECDCESPMTNNDRNEVIEQCATVVDQCNREGPYQAIAAAKRIRALKDFTPEPYCMQQALNQTCSEDPRKCAICGFEPDWRKNAAAAVGG